MSYLALDVETANADYSSICQIGIVHFKDGQIIDKWSTLVNPEAYFDPFNTSIHGITEKDIKDAPTFDVIHKFLANKITDKITVHHMPFDKVAITRACLEYNLEILQPKWLDSAKIARRTWEQFAYKGYGLANIASFLGIEFCHHDALEDAIAAAKIVDRACKQTQLSVEEWLLRVGQPIHIYKGGSTTIKLDGDPNGSLYGENLVFTGALSLPRKDAAQIAAKLGCNVGNSVTKQTSIIVVGTQDTTKLAGYEKSSKHRKAEELIQKGVLMKIVSEKDFIEMCNNEDQNLHLEVPKINDTSHKDYNIIIEPSEKSDITPKIKTNEKIIENFNNVWDNITDDQKEALYEANKEYQELLDSIKDCSHEQKRILAIEFKAIIERIQTFYDTFETESSEDDEIDIINTIDNETGQIHYVIYDLMKNRITLAEFYEAIDNSIEFIESDFEDSSLPKRFTDYCNATLTELKRIKERILMHANKEYTP